MLGLTHRQHEIQFMDYRGGSEGGRRRGGVRKEPPLRMGGQRKEDRQEGQEGRIGARRGEEGRGKNMDGVGRK